MANKNVPDYADMGTYVQTTFNTDVQKIEAVDVNSKDFKELLVRLYQDLSKMLTALNNKSAGYYPLTEFVDGNKFFPVSTNSNTQQVVWRQEFTKVINFGALPNAGTKSVAHGLTITGNTNFFFTAIYGTSENPSTPLFIPIPFVDVADPVSIDVDATNVNITTISNLSAYTQTYVILKYLKS